MVGQGRPDFHKEVVGQGRLEFQPEPVGQGAGIQKLSPQGWVDLQKEVVSQRRLDCQKGPVGKGVVRLPGRSCRAMGRVDFQKELFGQGADLSHEWHQ